VLCGANFKFHLCYYIFDDMQLLLSLSILSLCISSVFLEYACVRVINKGTSTYDVEVWNTDGTYAGDVALSNGSYHAFTTTNGIFKRIQLKTADMESGELCSKIEKVVLFGDIFTEDTGCTSQPAEIPLLPGICHKPPCCKTTLTIAYSYTDNTWTITGRTADHTAAPHVIWNCTHNIAVLETGLSDEDWETIMEEYGIHCENEEDCNEKRENYEAANAFVDEQNSRGICVPGLLCDGRKPTYNLTINSFSFMNEANRSQLFGLVVPEELEIPEHQIILQSLQNLSESVDWRNKSGGYYLTPVKNQGTCGSCWAFAATAVLESHWAIAFGLDHLFSLSEQNILDCTYGASTDGCRGGIYSDAWQRIGSQNGKTPGQNLDAIYPYTGVNEDCLFNGEWSNIGATTVEGVDGRFWEYINVESNSALMEALDTRGPVAVAVHSNRAWSFYGSGVLSGSDCTGSVNHAVVAIGYGTDTELNTDYWLIRNSWGSGWGEDGYIRLERTDNDEDGGPCGLLKLPMIPHVGLNPGC